MSDEPEGAAPDEGGRPSRTRGEEARLEYDQGTFLANYARCGNITQAANDSNIHRQRHYEWELDPKYHAAFLAAGDMYADSLEQKATELAREGAERPVYQGGRQVGTVVEQQPQLLMFLLKAARPWKYRDSVTGASSGDADLSGGLDERLRQKLMDELDEWATVGADAPAD